MLYHNKKMLYYIIFIGMLLANSAKAVVCPLCVVAVGTGVGLCRWLGIDDTISGLWIGGLLVALIVLTLYWMKKRNFNFKFDWFLVSAAYYILVIWPLYSFNIMGHPLNKVWGIDKILLGIISGSIIFLISVWFNNFLKNKNQGKVYFPYQKVVIPVAFLLIMSFVFYIIIKCQ
jgi:hypothetical protein